jgi:hypothetical protein
VPRFIRPVWVIKVIQIIVDRERNFLRAGDLPSMKSPVGLIGLVFRASLQLSLFAILSDI